MCAIESIAFPRVYLLTDGRGCTESVPEGCGLVNLQYHADIMSQRGSQLYEFFRFVRVREGVYAIESIAFPRVYLRADGRDSTQSYSEGTGLVNLQYHADIMSHSGSALWEFFRVVRIRGNVVAIESVTYPGVYLRLDGRGCTQSDTEGCGRVNLQYHADIMSQRDSALYEFFRLVRVR